MKDEIKEVHIKSYDEWLKYYENATKEQVIEDLTRDVEYFADAVKDIKYLQEENDRLKENAIHNDKVVDKAKWNEMIYKSRNEKAIEYIKEHRRADLVFKLYLTEQETDNVLNILQGGDK